MAGAVRINQVGRKQRVVFDAFDAHFGRKILHRPLCNLLYGRHVRRRERHLAAVAVQQGQRAFPVVNGFLDQAVFERFFD